MPLHDVSVPDRASVMVENSTFTVASASFLMAGLACLITPRVAGKLLVVCSIGYIETGLVNNGGYAQIRYGTGAAPAHNAAVTGTTLGGITYGAANATNTYVPSALTGLVTGLLVGTPYWFDLAVHGDTTTTVNFGSVTMIASEV